MNDYLIMGKNPVQEVIRHSPERVLQVFVQKAGSEFAGFPVKVLPKEALDRMVMSDSHQGVVARLKPPKLLSLKEFLEVQRERSIVLMLDSIFDPQNFGAILRAAHCFGVDGVIWSKNRGVDLTPAVSKASAGASEFVPLVRISNLAEGVSEMQEAGYEAYTAEVGQDSQSIYAFKRPPKILLILGSEGKGVQPLIHKRANGCLHLPMQGILDSLNVSQATTAFLTIFSMQ